MIRRHAFMTQLWSTTEEQMFKKIHAFAKDESGATAIEYGLIAALVSVAAIAALRGMGESLSNLFGLVHGHRLRRRLRQAVGPQTGERHGPSPSGPPKAISGNGPGQRAPARSASPVALRRSEVDFKTRQGNGRRGRPGAG
jgi:pilus assembly protein Flp/PilA